MLSDVRIHDDPESKREADAIGAAAFTRDGEISLGTAAPPLDSVGGRELLRHELAHVVQQRKAGEHRSGAINEPGDAFERAAETGSAPPSGAPPAIQRQFVGESKLAFRPQIEAAIRTYLETIRARHGGSLDLTDLEKAPLLKLAMASDPRKKGTGPDPKSKDRGTALSALLDHPGPFAASAALAAKIAGILPDPMDPAALAQLIPPSTGAKPSFFEQVGSAIKKTTPASPNFGTPDAVDRSKEAARAATIHEVLPSLPAGQIVEAGRELAKDKPKPPAAPVQKAPPRASPQKDAPPAKETGPRPEPDLVITPAMRSRTTANVSMAVAALTQALEVQKGAAEVTLRLGEDYAKLSAADQANILQQLDSSIPSIMATHPALIQGVSTIKVFLGDRLAKTIRVSGGSR
jgi:hypothetical protein